MMILELQVNIRPEYNNNTEPKTVFGDLNIRESFKIKAKDFFELTAILAQFHALAEAVKNDTETMHSV